MSEIRNLSVFWILTLTLWVSAAMITPAGAARSVEPVAEDELLDIGIQLFDPGTDQSRYRSAGLAEINPDVRRAEAAFVAVHLMRTLQETERFGLVRMVPRGSVTADLMISGRIHHSSGRRLALEFEVVDATGRRWLRRAYLQHADPYTYSLGFDQDIEPYQALYDQFAIDLIKVLNRKKEQRLAEVRQVAELRFAAQLAPAIFGDYLRIKKKGRVVLQRLPSHDDPMLERIRRIQTRDEFFLDLLTERYQSFYATMDRPYDDYRATSFEVEMALRYAKIQVYLANARPMLGPRGALRPRSPMMTQREHYFRQQAALKARYLDDMARSFALVIEPLRLELDGEIIRFEGTIEDQYRQWQELLEEIFETETGLEIADPPISSTDVNARR